MSSHLGTVARLILIVTLPLVTYTCVRAAETDDADWNIEAPPGPSQTQSIETDEGTWISVDVSPDGKQIVFDLLGDLYLMPIDGADGTGGAFPKKLTTGVAWDMQPRFSPDGKRIAFTSDRHGESKKAGDNIWTIEVDGTNPSQITNETYRLLNGPNWSPDGQFLVARKHFTSRRSLGAGEMWMYHRAAANADAMSGVPLTKRINDQKDVNEPIFSPDGRYLYYSQDTTPGNTFEYDKDSHKQIYVVKRLDLNTGEIEDFHQRTRWRVSANAVTRRKNNRICPPRWFQDRSPSVRHKHRGRATALRPARTRHARGMGDSRSLSSVCLDSGRKVDRDLGAGQDSPN